MSSGTETASVPVIVACSLSSLLKRTIHGLNSTLLEPLLTHESYWHIVSGLSFPQYQFLFRSTVLEASPSVGKTYTDLVNEVYLRASQTTIITLATS